jgi:hypothetical protein
VQRGSPFLEVVQLGGDVLRRHRDHGEVRRDPVPPLGARPELTRQPYGPLVPVGKVDRDVLLAQGERDRGADQAGPDDQHAAHQAHRLLTS